MLTISENLRKPAYPKRQIVIILKSVRQLFSLPYFSARRNKWKGEIGSFFVTGFLHSLNTPSLTCVTKEEWHGFG